MKLLLKHQNSSLKLILKESVSPEIGIYIILFAYFKIRANKYEEYYSIRVLC